MNKCTQEALDRLNGAYVPDYLRGRLQEMAYQMPQPDIEELHSNGMRLIYNHDKNTNDIAFSLTINEDKATENTNQEVKKSLMTRLIATALIRSESEDMKRLGLTAHLQEGVLEFNGKTDLVNLQDMFDFQGHLCQKTNLDYAQEIPALQNHYMQNLTPIDEVTLMTHRADNLLNRYLVALQDITPEDLKAQSKYLFNPERMVLTARGSIPADLFKSVLVHSTLGQIKPSPKPDHEVFDSIACAYAKHKMTQR